MKIKDIKIETQLKIGFGVIIVLILILSAISWQQTDKIAAQATDMYNHPLKVRRALGELKSDILYIRLGMKEVSLAENNEEIAHALQVIEKYEANAFEQFEVMSTLYLGPPEDIKAAYSDFLRWNTIREETIRLRREGKIKEATARSRTDGVEVNQAEKLLSRFLKIDIFALTKGDQLYLNSVDLNKSLNYQLGFLVLGIFVLIFLIVYFLSKNIRSPLEELITVAHKFKSGKFDIRVQYASNNEYGLLANAFNDLANTIETELTLNTQSSKLSEVMLGEDDAHKFCNALLSNLIEQTGAQMGAVYLLNDVKTEFNHFECIGMDAEGCKSFSATRHEGEFGIAIVSKKMQHITSIPDNSRFTFSTVSGKFTPSEIITIPIVSGNETIAIFSLVTIKTFSNNSLRLINTILNTLSARMDGILTYRKVISFSLDLEQKNNELDRQKDELSTQTNELTEQNMELEIQKKELDDANQLKTNFLSNMSHELRTPLNSVIALSDVLNNRLAGKIADEEYSYLDVIGRNGKKLLTLINDILDLSRIEAGHEEIEIKKFNINELIGDIVNMIEPQAKLKNVGLVYDPNENLPMINTDFAKCLHILQNLVDNAVKFTEEGKVEITTEVKNEFIYIEISDTGIGIDKNFLPLLFDQFRQADESNSRKTSGTGLGMAIAKKYIDMLGAKISVESELGKGSKFTFILPLHFFDDKSIHEVNHSTRLKTESNNEISIDNLHNGDKTILLVEDNEAIMIQMKEMLEAQGYNVMTANNGSEALERITQKVPDGMILDLMMPEVDGFEVLKRIRKEDKTKRLPVIILTAKYVTKEELSFLKENGILQLISKGDIDKTQLQEVVAKMLFSGEELNKTLKEKPVRKVVSDTPVVLVVEDNADNMITIKAMLKGRCSVIEANDGIKGVEMAKKHQPHLILMDIALPGMNGIEALAEIRRETNLQHIPVIAVTASAMKGDKESFMAYGFDDYISKPIDNNIFTKTVNRFFEQ